MRGDGGIDGGTDPPTDAPMSGPIGSPTADRTESIRWMTYQALAEALGIGADSARNLVRRKRWARQTGNDGLARIGVPEDHLETHDRGTDGPSDIPSDGATDAPADGGIVPALEAHVASLQAEVQRLAISAAEQRADIEHERNRATVLADELVVVRAKLADVEAERDTERAQAGQVAVLQAVLEIERQRLAEAQTDVAQWREAATQPRGIWAWLKVRS